MTGWGYVIVKKKIWVCLCWYQGKKGRLKRDGVESFIDLLQWFGEAGKEFLYFHSYLNCSFSIKEWKLFLGKRALRVFLPQVEACDNLVTGLFWRNILQSRRGVGAPLEGCSRLCIGSRVTYLFLTHSSLNTDQNLNDSSQNCSDILKGTGAFWYIGWHTERLERKAGRCIPHRDELLCSARSDLGLVNVLTRGSPFQKVWVTFIYFLSLMST